MAKTTFRNDYRKYYDEVIEYSINAHCKFSFHNACLFLLYGVSLGFIDIANSLSTRAICFVISIISMMVYAVSKSRIIKNRKATACFYNIYLFVFLLEITILYFVHPSHIAYTILICSIITTAMTNMHPIYYDLILLVVFFIDIAIHFCLQDVGDIADIVGYILNNILVYSFSVGINLLVADMKFKEFKQKHFLQNESYHDPLTNIFNRRYVERYVDLHLDGTEEWAMFLMDVDNFKLVNDNLGHEYGDELLCRISDILRNSFRKADCVARIGGDEFLILMPKIDDKQMVVEKTKQILRNFPIEMEDVNGYQTVEVSVSIGIAFGRKGEEITYEEMYRKADHFMYKAKEKGKGIAVIEGTNGKREQIIV